MQEPKMKKIYIERKYNTKLAYQIHNIMQAKRIEEDRQKIIKGMDQTQESPLINNVLKVTNTDRKTPQNRDISKHNISFRQ